VSAGIAGKVVLILGGAGGIGSAAARDLAAQKARIATADIDGPKARSVAQDVIANGGVARGYAVDVVDLAQVQALVGAILADFGRIDVLINSAGVMYVRPLAELNTNEWDTTIDLNLKGSLWGVAAVLPAFFAQGRGHIVNLGSVHGLKVFSPGGAVHSASKFAIRAFTEGLRAELAGTGIRVTTITPGATDTGMQYKTTGTDGARMRAIYENAIPAKAVSEAIVYAISQPDEIAVNEVVIRPATQAI
jgi:NADP-dependent 3-hydroxy acid dehydrogenase YdfG